MSHPLHSSAPHPSNAPRVLLIGGLTRLLPHYRANVPGCQLAVANVDSPLIARSLQSFDAVVVVPNQISHRAARRVLSEMRRTKLRVGMARSSGVGSVRMAIEEALG